MAIRPFEVDLEAPRPANPNVADLYRESTLAEVRADLDTRRSPAVSICMNLTRDFNKGAVVRASNAFLGRAVYLVGSRHYNRVGTVGTHLYEHVYSADTLEEVLEVLEAEGYEVFAVDNQPAYHPESLWEVALPEKSAFLFGEEQAGLSPQALALCSRSIFIQQRGSVRSLNVAQAAACVLAEYTRQHPQAL